jgi:hypothetical protein
VAEPSRIPSTFLLTIYVPVVFGLLVALALGAPALVAVMTAGTQEKPRIIRVLAAAIVFPLLCLCGSWLYFGFALPLAARTVYWLHPDEVLRAANGPAYVAFK